MLEFLRRQQTWMMMIIAIIIIIAFAWLYDPNRGALEDPDVALQIYGKSYRQTEVQQIAKRFEIAQILQLGTLTDLLPGADRRFSRGDEGVPTDFIVNLIVMRNEASRHGIAVSNAEIENGIRELPGLQKNGTYDPARWNMLVGMLEQRGLDASDIFTTVGDHLLVRKAVSLFGSGIRPSAIETEKIYDHFYSTIKGSAFTLDRADFESGVTASDEEITEFHAANGENLLSEERRRIDYVFFPALSGLDTLSTEERLEKEKNHNRRIQDYSTAVVAENADFEAITRQIGQEMAVTELFTAAQPPEALAGETQLVAAIFDPRRTLEDPVSDPISAQEGTYIFRLAEIIEPAPMTLAEARQLITERVIEEKIDAALRDAAQKARDAVVDAAAANEDVVAAATAASASVQQIEDFQLGTPPATYPYSQIVTGLAAELQAGEVSQVAPTEDGVIFFYCASKTLGEDPERDQRLTRIGENFALADQRLIFNGWFQQVKDAAGLEH
jgi:hypothetical protein